VHRHPSAAGIEDREQSFVILPEQPGKRSSVANCSRFSAAAPMKKA
jgi:hypothetical protein